MPDVRLTEGGRRAIIDTVKSYDPNASVLLYGSRVDTNLKGGDIDLLILSDGLGFSEKLSILSDIKLLIGEQKIDLTILTEVRLKQHPFFSKIEYVNLAV